MQLIDVSHTMESGMLTYKGLPAPMICDYLARDASRKLYTAGTEFQIGRIDMAGRRSAGIGRGDWGGFSRRSLRVSSGWSHVAQIRCA